MDEEFIGKDYISAQDWSDQEINRLLELASKLKNEFQCPPKF